MQIYASSCSNGSCCLASNKTGDGKLKSANKSFSCFRPAVLCSFACQKVKHAHFLTFLSNGTKKKKPQCSTNFEIALFRPKMKSAKAEKKNNEEEVGKTVAQPRRKYKSINFPAKTNRTLIRAMGQHEGYTSVECPGPTFESAKI